MEPNEPLPEILTGRQPSLFPQSRRRRWLVAILGTLIVLTTCYRPKVRIRPRELVVATMDLPSWPMTGHGEYRDQGELSWQEPKWKEQDIRLLWASDAENPESLVTLSRQAAAAMSFQPHGTVPVGSGEVAELWGASSLRGSTATAFWREAGSVRTFSIDVNVAARWGSAEDLLKRMVATFQPNRSVVPTTPHRDIRVPQIPAGWTLRRTADVDIFAGPDHAQCMLGNGMNGKLIAKIPLTEERRMALTTLKALWQAPPAKEPDRTVRMVGDNELRIWHAQAVGKEGDLRELTVLYQTCGRVDRSSTGGLDLPADATWPTFLDDALRARCE